VGSAAQVGAGAAQVGSAQVASQQLGWQQPPRLNRPAWASLANNEAAPATSNKANRIFAFMGVLKKGEQDVYFAATRRFPSNALATKFLIGSNRQSLRMALTGQIGFTICGLIASSRSCQGQRRMRL
jgi:hypothetical protein